MLTLLEGKAENAEANKAFERAFENFADKTERLNVGWKGGSVFTKISWSSELKIWWAFRKSMRGTPRYVRLFGITEPHWTTNKSHTILGEINSPVQGTNRKAGGAFAADAKGNCVVVHRGNIGGGRLGIGKGLFFSQSDSKKVMVQDSKGVVEVALIGELGSERFCWQVAKFVHDVGRVKSLTTNTIQPVVSVLPKEYYKEPIGLRGYKLSGDVIADCDHGLVVDAMRKVVERENYKPGKDKFCDLYALNQREEVKVLFEFKTSVSLSHLYSAIGQLFFHSTQHSKARLVAVFPAPLSSSVVHRLKQLGIACVTYSWKNGRPRFGLLKGVL